MKPSSNTEDFSTIFNRYTQRLALFKSQTSIKRKVIDLEPHGDYIWNYIEIGPKNQLPIIFFPPAGCPLEIYYEMFLSMENADFRAIIVKNPPVESHDEWIHIFSKFLEKKKIERFHVFGTGLGAFLTLLYARVHPQQIASFVILNGFAKNNNSESSSLQLSFVPSFIQRRNFTGRYKSGSTQTTTPKILAAIDFACGLISQVPKKEIGSDQTLMHRPAFADLNMVPDENVLLLRTNDFSTEDPKLLDSLWKGFTAAKKVDLKQGGDFAMITEADEISMYLKVHLRKYSFELLPQLNIDPKHADLPTTLKSLGQEDDFLYEPTPSTDQHPLHGIHPALMDIPAYYLEDPEPQENGPVEDEELDIDLEDDSGHDEG